MTSIKCVNLKMTKISGWNCCLKLFLCPKNPETSLPEYSRDVIEIWRYPERVGDTQLPIQDDFILLVQVHVFLDTLEMRSYEENRMYLVDQYKVLMSSYWTWCGAFQQNSPICIRNSLFSPENLGDLRWFVTSRSSGSFRSVHTSLRWTSDRFYFDSTCTNLISSCQKKKKKFSH